MDDRKFREIMEDYARSTAKGKDVDFAKLNRAEKSPKRKINLRWVTAVCSAVVIIAVSLAVALPLTLGGNPNEGVTPGQGDEPQYYYCKDEKLTNIEVDSFETLREGYGIDSLQPSIAAVTGKFSAIYSEEYNVTIGSKVELMVFDSNFDFIYIQAVNAVYVIEGLTQFDNLDGVAMWGGYYINYSVGDFNEEGHRVYRITFAAGKYRYFIEVDYYGEFEAATVLDMIYG